MSDHDIVEWEGWFEGSRMDLDPAWFDRQIINTNAIIRQHGWKPIEVVYVKERTTWLRRNFTFKIKGERRPIAVVQNAMREIATRLV